MSKATGRMVFRKSNAPLSYDEKRVEVHTMEDIYQLFQTMGSDLPHRLEISGKSDKSMEEVLIFEFANSRQVES